MQCMKCGREILAGQVFCEGCLSDMKKYPVKPGTVVQLPRRKEEPAPQKAPSRRPALKPEEQVKRLKKRLWIVTVTAVLLLALSGTGLYLAVEHILENDGKPLPGQNYSSEESAPPIGAR